MEGCVRVPRGRRVLGSRSFGRGHRRVPQRAHGQDAGGREGERGGHGREGGPGGVGPGHVRGAAGGGAHARGRCPGRGVRGGIHREGIDAARSGDGLDLLSHLQAARARARQTGGHGHHRAGRHRGAGGGARGVRRQRDPRLHPHGQVHGQEVTSPVRINITLNAECRSQPSRR